MLAFPSCSPTIVADDEIGLAGADTSGVKSTVELELDPELLLSFDDLSDFRIS